LGDFSWGKEAKSRKTSIFFGKHFFFKQNLMKLILAKSEDRTKFILNQNRHKDISITTVPAVLFELQMKLKCILRVMTVVKYGSEA
jgi:hypothetical protein